MTQHPRSSRLADALREALSQRRWLLLPIPLAVGTMIANRGPYPVAGGYLTAYLLVAAVIAANIALLMYRNRTPWIATASLAVLSLAGGGFTYAAPNSALVTLPFIAAAIAARRSTGLHVWIVIGVSAVSLIPQVPSHRAGLGIVADLSILAAVSGWSFARRTRLDRLEQMELALAREQTAREEHARAAALDERARIAREMHDVLAHSLSALSLNLQGARLMLNRDGASPEAVAQVERAQKLAADGLAEARRAVSALREDTVPAARGIADLVTSARLETGNPAELTVLGAPRELSGSAEATLYRTAQEALTNSRKHASGAPVAVLLSYLADRVELTVTDDQGRRPTPGPPGSYGLIGMRERVELIGGELEVGPTDTGWRVHLVVPS
ncbi:MAG TPA: sensor histidine kinase [Pseudonocardiaceae bacterium]|nr:sensor histidine kinase [Pseudonocardiaceae bacterium]